MKKFPVFPVFFAALLLAGCLGGGSSDAEGSKSLSPSSQTPSPNIKPETSIVVEISSIQSIKFSKTVFEASLSFAPPKRLAVTDEGNNPVELGSINIRSGERQKLELVLRPVYAEAREGDRVEFISPSDSISFELPELGSDAFMSVHVDIDASVHRTNSADWAFLPVVEAALTPAGGAPWKTRVGMNEKGETGADKIIPPELNILVSQDAAGKTVFQVDNTPPDIPFG